MSAEIDPLTKQKQAEEELKRYRDHLEDLVIERTAELRAANQHLQREISERKLVETERERLLIAEREQRLLAETMQEVILALASQTSHTAVLEEILRQAQRIVPYKTAHIALLEGEMLRIAHWYGYYAYEYEELISHLFQRVADFPLDQWVVQSRAPLAIPDTQLDSRWVARAETAWIKSHIAVPICLQEQVLGLLRLDSDITGKFSSEDAQRLQALANAAAIALANARLYAETQQRLKEQTALREAGAVISSTLDLTTVLNYLIEQMGQAIDATSTYISGFNPDFSWTVLAEYYGPEASVAEKASDLGVSYSTPADDPEYLKFLRAGHIEILHQDGPNIHEIAREQLQQYGVQSALLIPLHINGELIAFADLWESRYRREFTPAEINLCQTMAQQAAIAIHNAQLYQQTQRQARQMEQILHSIREGVLLLDTDYRVKLANAVGQNYLALLAGGEVGQVLAQLGGRPLAEVLVPLPSGQAHELRPVGAASPLFHVYAHPVVAGQVETEGWVIVVRDVTDEQNIQKRMQQQEKLAAVGQLAAGIAHDFNNILTSIIGFAELARYSPNLPPAVNDDLGRVVQQGQRAAHLVRQILDFARKNIAARRTIDLGQLLAEIVKLLERTIPEDIQLDLKIEPNQAGYSLNADPTQLQQALTNLAVNAADAMPTGGILKFNLLRFTLIEDRHPLYPELRPGDWLALAVSDTGIGMPAEVQKHLFEPFFTTKEVGQGTGLGLAQVEGIIKQHEGYIQVESTVGQGTLFTLYFPALSSSPPVKTPALLSQDSQPQGHGKLILLVEDNQSVREVVQAMLTSLGYEVLVASNGRSALQIYEQSQVSIALVITDITMPEMGGLALAEALRGKNQSVKILAMSGYPLKMASQDLSTRGIVGWLQKPLSFDHLAQQLKRVL